MVIFLDTSLCEICGEPVGNEKVVALRDFVRNQRDPLFALSGVPCHKRCFDGHPLASDARRRFEEWRSHIQPEQRICEVCGDQIGADWYWTDFITDDRQNPLMDFNYLHFHKSHLTAWARFEEFRRLVEAFESSGDYDGPSILPNPARDT